MYLSVKGFLLYSGVTLSTSIYGKVSQLFSKVSGFSVDVLFLTFKFGHFHTFPGTTLLLH